MKKVLLFLCVTLSAVSYAGGSKMIKVDLDEKGTQIVKAELDLDDLYYYIDTTACVCWVAKIVGGANSISVFDCKNLAKYSKLEQHLAGCGLSPKPSVVEPVVENPKAEVKVDESKETKKDK